MADGCSFSITSPDIGSLVTGILSSYKQTETWREFTDHYVPEELRTVLYDVVRCWTEKVCADTYSKENAISDSQEAVSEVINEEVALMTNAIDDLIHNAAKYNIPRIISDMSATRSYDNTCAQLLMCDAMREVRELRDELRNMGNEGARIQLQNIKDYANIMIEIANTDTRFWDIIVRSYRNQDFHEDIHNSISPEALTEIPIIVIVSALMTTIISAIYTPFYDAQNAAYTAALSNCANA